MAVPLSWSLPAFRPTCWDAVEGRLLALRGLGFRWVTLHPTWQVTESLDILTGTLPSVGPVVEMARSLGFWVRLEPHLDYVSVFEGRYVWRNEMRIDPTGPYFDLVLRPMAELLPDELTIGSELDNSTFEFTAQWRAVAAELGSFGIPLGHKVNHDWDERFLRRWRIGSYLESLDYKAVSFYTPEPWRLGPEWTIGEFGLGSTDVSRPYYFGEDLRFRSEADFEVRREWYLRFLTWLGGREGRAASFWTVAQFDVLGLQYPEWRDEAIVEAVRAYNYASP